MFCRPLPLALLMGLTLTVRATPPAGKERKSDPGPAAFRVQRWTTEDGLPQNRVACLKQTQDGYLWIGTWYGLARFDGLHFTVFNKFNTPELTGGRGDAITALAEDTEGTLWIGTGDGLVSYRDHRFHKWTTADGLPDLEVWRLARSRSGGVWFQAGYFVGRESHGAFSRAWQDTDGQRILSLDEGEDGWLNIFADREWLALSPNAGQTRTNWVSSSPEGELLAACPAGKTGGVWLGTGMGLQRYDKGDWQAIGADAPGPHAVDVIHEDRLGNVWAAERGGRLYRWDHTGWVAVDLGGGFANAATVCMTQDREGSVWVGTDRGLVQLQPRWVRAYTMADGLADDNVWSVCEGNDGAIWAGTDRGLSCVRAGKVVKLAAEEPQPESKDFCVWPCGPDGVWVGKRGAGLYAFQSGRFVERANLPPSLGIPNALFQAPSGRLLISTSQGLSVYQEGRLVPVQTGVAGQTERDVHPVLEDGEGNLWFGVKGEGLARLRNGTVSRFTESDGLSDNNVWSIHQDAEGTLWLGTENGLTRCRNGQPFAITPRQGLLEGTVNCVLEDDFGFLWLSGMHGIYRVARAQLNSVADGRTATVQCTSFNTADGMESPETNGGENQPAGWKAHDGRLWFPTSRGVVVLDPQEVEAGADVIQCPPPVVIEQAKADEDEVFGDTIHAAKASSSEPQTGSFPIRVAPGHSHVVEFRYTANSFVAPANMRFRYRLVGHDPHWREETGERVVRYANLRPGDYRFEVTAANHHNVWNPRPATLAFTLQPQFWQTWTFYVLCACGLIGLAAAVQAYRLKWQRRLLKLEEQRSLANERTRIARDLHDDLGTALTGLALELDVMGAEAKSAPRLAERLDRTSRRTRALAERMREVVWTVNPICDTVSSLASFIEQQVEQFLRLDQVKIRLDFPEDIPALPLNAEVRHQLALSVREALTNVVRHAQASEAVLRLAIDHRILVLEVQDNGRGFQSTGKNGHGLDNLRARLERIGGTCQCLSRPGHGTTITFRAPLDPVAAEPGGIG